MSKIPGPLNKINDKFIDLSTVNVQYIVVDFIKERVSHQCFDKKLCETQVLLLAKL